MKHYLDEENSAVTTSIGLNKDVFGDIETFVALTEMRDLRQNWWEGIGPGGSISARAHEHNGRVYVGACDGVFYCLDMDGNEIWRFNTMVLFTRDVMSLKKRGWFILDVQRVYCMHWT